MKGTKVPFNESSNVYRHMRAFQWIKQWLRAHERKSMNKAMTTGTWEPFNESIRAHESRSMNQVVIKGTKVSFNESSNDYGHMRTVQRIKRWLRAHESRSMYQIVIKRTKVPLMNQAMTTVTWEPFNESSNDYGNMRAVQWIKQLLRAHESRSMNQAEIKETKVPFNESSKDYGHKRGFQWIKKWLRAHENSFVTQAMTKAHASRSMNQAMTAGTCEPFNESSSK
jgi:hypothetical protein